MRLTYFLDLRKWLLGRLKVAVGRAAAARLRSARADSDQGVQRWKPQGSVAPAAMGEPQGWPLRPTRDWSVSCSGPPELTIDELQARWAEQAIPGAARRFTCCLERLG